MQRVSNSLETGTPKFCRPKSPLSDRLFTSELSKEEWNNGPVSFCSSLSQLIFTTPRGLSVWRGQFQADSVVESETPCEKDTRRGNALELFFGQDWLDASKVQAGLFEPGSWIVAIGFIVFWKNIEGACSHYACRNIHCHTRSFGGAQWRKWRCRSVWLGLNLDMLKLEIRDTRGSKDFFSIKDQHWGHFGWLFQPGVLTAHKRLNLPGEFLCEADASPGSTGWSDRTIHRIHGIRARGARGTGEGSGVGCGLVEHVSTTGVKISIYIYIYIHTHCIY